MCISGYCPHFSFKTTRLYLLCKLFLFPGKLAEVYVALKKIPTIKVYKKEDIPEKFHLKHNRRIQPILIVAKEGYTLCDDNHDCYETGIFSSYSLVCTYCYSKTCLVRALS